MEKFFRYLRIRQNLVYRTLGGDVLRFHERLRRMLLDVPVRRERCLVIGMLQHGLGVSRKEVYIDGYWSLREE